MRSCSSSSCSLVTVTVETLPGSRSTATVLTPSIALTSSVTLATQCSQVMPATRIVVTVSLMRFRILSLIPPWGMYILPPGGAAASNSRRTFNVHAVGPIRQPRGVTAPEPLRPDASGDDLLIAVESFADEQGLTLCPAQEEALIELVTPSHVILSTPTGTGKSLVALGAHS